MLQKDIDRFYLKIIFPIEIDQIDNDCWEFKAFHDKDGYAKFWYNSSQIGAHRFSYIIHNNFNFNIIEICHKCDNPGCVNPKHLWNGTNLDNMIDRNLKERHTKGSESHLSYLTDDQIFTILNNIMNGVYISIYQICVDFKICQDTVYKLLYGETWKHITKNYNLKYLISRVRHSHLTQLQKLEIQNKLKLGISKTEISKEYNRHITTIHRISNEIL